MIFIKTVPKREPSPRVLKTQVLFVLLFSYLTFKDKPRLETLIGSAIMIAGVVLIKIGL